MTLDPLNALMTLRESIAALEAVACQMAHERVKNGPTGAPLPDALHPSGFVRIGFCPPTERAKRLGCGHTMARYVLERGIAALDRPSVRDALETRLRLVTNEIHSLDHRKGDAEKHLAHLRTLVPSPAAELANAAATVRSIEERHTDCVQKIGNLQHEVLAQLDAQIAGAKSRRGICG